MKNTQWLIWCHERNKYWADNKAGYVESRMEAGRYSFAEALEIVQQANLLRPNKPEESMLPDKDI